MLDNHRYMHDVCCKQKSTCRSFLAVIFFSCLFFLTPSTVPFAQSEDNKAKSARPEGNVTDSNRAQSDTNESFFS
jgi:hypothetical protein